MTNQLSELKRELLAADSAIDRRWLEVQESRRCG